MTPKLFVSQQKHDYKATHVSGNDISVKSWPTNSTATRHNGIVMLEKDHVFFVRCMTAILFCGRIFQFPHHPYGDITSESWLDLSCSNDSGTRFCPAILASVSGSFSQLFHKQYCDSYSKSKVVSNKILVLFPSIQVHFTYFHYLLNWLRFQTRASTR